MSVVNLLLRGSPWRSTLSVFGPWQVVDGVRGHHGTGAVDALGLRLLLQIFLQQVLGASV